MSKYTTLLRWPIEQKLDDLKLPHEEANWPKCYKMLGLDDYPIFDETYRETLNDKIIRHYYFREIGFETIGQFSWQLRAYMHEIMPYYNQLYKSQDLVTEPGYSKNMDFDETWTRDEGIQNGMEHSMNRSENETTNLSENRDTTEDKNLTETQDTTYKESTTGHKGSTDTRDTTTNVKTTGKTTVDASTTSDDRNVFQDTPMNGLDTGAIEAMDYATNVTFDHGTTTEKSTTNTEGTSDTTQHMVDTYTEDTTGSKDSTTDYDRTQKEGRTENEKHTADTTRAETDTQHDTENRKEVGDYDGTRKHNEKGYDRPQAELLLLYRQTFVNIDLEIINRLNVLFMGLW